jgi:hypothetical protein
VKSYRPVLVLLLLTALPALASAGVFFGKKTVRVDPAQRVPQLLATVKSDGDESRRASAAEELRDYDPGQFPEIVTVLADVLLTDAKVGVRAEAAHTLGKLRPINQQAGWALEQAAARDSSLRVRLAAKTALMGYYMAGYKGNKKDPNTMPTTNEPPLADPTARVSPTPMPAPTVRTAQPTPSLVQPTRVVPNETPPPPLADPLPLPSLAPSPAPTQSTAPRPMSPLVPTQTPVLEPAPTGPATEGPSLFMPE